MVRCPVEETGRNSVSPSTIAEQEGVQVGQRPRNRSRSSVGSVVGQAGLVQQLGHRAHDMQSRSSRSPRRGRRDSVVDPGLGVARPAGHGSASRGPMRAVWSMSSAAPPPRRPGAAGRGRGPGPRAAASSKPIRTASGVVEVLLPRAHAADVERGVGAQRLGGRLDVVVDDHRHRGDDVEAGQRRPRRARGRPARRRPRRTSSRSPECSGLKKIASQPSAISPASSRFFGPDRGEVDRQPARAPGARSAAAPCPGRRAAAGSSAGPAYATGLAAQRHPDDVDVLAGAPERVVEADAVPALAHLRAGDARGRAGSGPRTACPAWRRSSPSSRACGPGSASPRRPGRSARSGRRPRRGRWGRPSRTPRPPRPRQ